MRKIFFAIFIFGSISVRMYKPVEKSENIKINRFSWENC